MQTVRVILVREGTPDPPVTTPDEVVDLLRERLQDLDREHFVVLHLDAKHSPTGLDTVSIGTLSATLVHPREVFKAAILASAGAILLAHNHPSGDVTPSKDDVDLTRRMVEAGRIIGIEVIDHIIIGDGHHLSFRERGLI